jgi:hypothetical protein
MAIATFVDRESGEPLLKIELCSDTSNGFKHGDTIWTALEGDQPGDKTFPVSDPSGEDFISLYEQFSPLMDQNL